MNILLVSQNYFPFVGGIEVHVRQIAHSFKEAGHTVRIAAGNFAPSRLPARLATLHNNLLAPSATDFIDDGIEVTALAPSKWDRIRLLPAAVRAIPRLQRFAFHALNRFAYRYAYRNVYVPRLYRLAESADLVHVQAGGHIAWAAGEAARRAGARLVVTPHVHPRQWGDGPDDVAFYRGADAVIGMLDSDRDYLASIGVPAGILHSGAVSPELPATADGAAFRRRHGLGDHPVVLYLGRLMAQKGAPAVLASAGRVWKSMPEARFVFIGPATPAEAAAFVGADPRVKYLGKVSDQEKADALDACTTLCMPSMSELVGIVFLEAWTFCKPVIGGFADALPGLIVGNDAGLCAEQTGPAVAAAITKLLKDPGLRSRLGENGKALVERRFTRRVVTGQLIALYESLLQSSPSSATARNQSGVNR